VTVSEDFRTAAAVVPAQATPAQATPAQATPARATTSALLVPAPAGSPEVALSTRVGHAVGALRRALEDGTVHHHRRNGVPETWTAVGVEVVRAWVAGLGVDEQARACRTCAPAVAG
jgi:hypothetical protein